MPSLHYQDPDRLVGATAFSKHERLCGSLNVVNLLKGQPWVRDALRQACDGLEVNHGRKREEGHWELAAVAFVVSGHVDLQPWWANTTNDLWEACEFKKGRPPYNRVWERLRELGERRSKAFLDVAALVIQRCREHDGRVLAHVHVDFTEDETHAALVHDCKPGESCKREEDDANGGSGRGGEEYRPQRAPTLAAREQREEWNEQEPTESEQNARRAEPEEIVDSSRADGRAVRRIRVGDCWYLTRDCEAGTRAYTTRNKVKRFWHGYYSGKIVDNLTSGVIPSVDPANKQEYDLFPALFERACEMAGATPQTVIGDKGFAVEKCYKYVTGKGAAPVFPWRGGSKRKDYLTHDRDGMMRCKHCGGVMKQRRFAIETRKTKKEQTNPTAKKKETPWLWFQCQAPRLPECKKEQRIRCETDWRALVPLSRLEPLYHELRKTHYEYEGAHDYWRDRYKVAADTLANRPKIVSLNWHRLRANVACLIDWLRIAELNDWLGSARATKRARKGVRRKLEAGVRAVAELMKEREDNGLDLPYGPQAERLGFGDARPPSNRMSGAPPGP